VRRSTIGEIMMSDSEQSGAQSRQKPSAGSAGYVLLHGAMLGGWIWEAVTPLLSAPALAVDLPRPGAGPADRAAGPTLQEAIDTVAADAEVGAFVPEQVVLVAHSLSGILVPGLQSRLGPRIAHVVFVGAAVPVPGVSYLGTLSLPERLFLRVLLQIQRRGLLAPAWAARRTLCNDLDEATTRRLIARLTREPRRFYTDPVPGALSPDIPCLYVKLLRDRAVSPSTQDEAIRRLPGARIRTVDSGHLPMLGRPEELAALLNAVLG
jgi:pimeloyl-ACP methyl ester carboxylesterase